MILDQLQKIWTIAYFHTHPAAKVEITPFLDVMLVWNPGVSYGLFKQHSETGQLALASVAGAAVAALCYWLVKVETSRAAAALGLIMGGAAGNAIDRIAYGAVADFFSFHLRGYSWYVFNLADAAIVLGVALLLYDSLKHSHINAGNTP